jgi:cytosine/adenosine deaminase-related metal-dependent hydrolase
MAKKGTNVEVDGRVNAVYDLLLQAYSRAQIVRHCAEKWDISERQAENYIARARKLQQLDAELERPEWLAAAIARLQDYEREARKRGNLSIAIKALENQAKLLRFEMNG